MPATIHQPPGKTPHRPPMPRGHQAILDWFADPANQGDQSEVDAWRAAHPAA